MPFSSLLLDIGHLERSFQESIMLRSEMGQSYHDSQSLHPPVSGGVRTGIAMHCGCRIFKMAAKVEKFPRLYALYFERHSSFLRKLSTIT